jgi:ADP-ribose pyrophosphatase YjhB (NUDIX family)
MMDAPRLFRFCPRCGGRTDVEPPANDRFHCDACGLLYFFNPAVSVAALILRDDGRGLFIRRAKDPGRGKLALVGGFVDFGETAEAALRREVREETNLELGPLAYLSSHPNDYHYEDVTYPVLDLVFVGRAVDASRAVALDDVTSVTWEDPRTIVLEEVAFESMRDALRRYRSSR